MALGIYQITTYLLFFEEQHPFVRMPLSTRKMCRKQMPHLVASPATNFQAKA